MTEKTLLLIAIIVIIALVPLAIMILWNWLITDIFLLREINFWEAFGLSILTELLFKRIPLK